MEIIHIFNPESIANAYADAADEAQELHMMFNRLLDKIRHYENCADAEGRQLTYDEICAYSTFRDISSMYTTRILAAGFAYFTA